MRILFVGWIFGNKCTLAHSAVYGGASEASRHPRGTFRALDFSICCITYLLPYKSLVITVIRRCLHITTDRTSNLLTAVNSIGGKIMICLWPFSVSKFCDIFHLLYCIRVINGGTNIVILPIIILQGLELFRQASCPSFLFLYN